MRARIMVPIAMLVSATAVAAVASAEEQARPIAFDPAVVWEFIPSPPVTMDELVGVGGALIARDWMRYDLGWLYRSVDGGETWQPLPYPKEAGAVYDMCVDGADLYLACDNGMLKSSDRGDRFTWEYHWHWDRTFYVSVTRGWGWAEIDNYGSASGPRRKEPTAYWRSAGSKSEQFSAIDDPEKLGTVAYSPFHGRSLDGGKTWVGCAHRVESAVLLGGQSAVFAAGFVSRDFGETWEPSGTSASEFAKDPVTELRV